MLHNSSYSPIHPVVAAAAAAAAAEVVAVQGAAAGEHRTRHLNHTAAVEVEEGNPIPSSADNQHHRRLPHMLAAVDRTVECAVRTLTKHYGVEAAY